MEIYLIRHTKPAIAEGIIYGRTDIPVADTFYEESIAVLNQLPDNIDHVFSSPSTRCFKLAALIANNYATDDLLQEFNFGDWEGNTWDEINKADLENWMADFVNLTVSGGESMLQMADRVMKFWGKLSKLPFKTVAIVTHAGVIRIILSKLNNVALKDAFDFKITYGEVIKIKQ